MGWLRRARAFLAEGIWLPEASPASVPGRTLYSFLRVLVMALRGVFRHRVGVWASSLTFITLVSLVPFVALVAGVSARLGAPENLLEMLSGQISEEQYRVIENATRSFEEADLRALGMVAVVVLLWAMVRVFTAIENAFNEIWGVERGRSIGRRIANYVTATVVAPLLALSALALSATLRSSAVADRIAALPGAGAGLRLLLFAFPYLALWLALTLLYKLMPNTRVRWVPALTGAVAAGTLWHVAQQGYLTSQIAIARLGFVYGAFSAIPIFLIWVYVGWLIVLFGTELCYGVQHANTYVRERGDESFSAECLEQTALRTALLLARCFEEGEGAIDPPEVARRLDAPARLVNRVLGLLREGGLVSREEDGRALISKPPRLITAADVVRAVRSRGERLLEVRDDPPGSVAAVRDLRERSMAPLEVPIADLLAGAEGRRSPPRDG